MMLISGLGGGRTKPGFLSPGFHFKKQEGITIMARKPGTKAGGEFALFDVVYVDGSQRSNRRVPVGILGGLDGDEPAKQAIHEQDLAIAEKSGQAALEIKSIRRSGTK